MTIKDFRIGQTAMIAGDGRYGVADKRGMGQVTVTKIGRKYVTAQDDVGREMRFRACETEQSYLIEETEIGSPRLLFPSEQAIEEYYELERLKHEIRKMMDWSRIGRYSLSQLRAVKNILEE